MCAGKLLNLIKKCLNREKNQHQQQQQGDKGPGSGGQPTRGGNSGGEKPGGKKGRSPTPPSGGTRYSAPPPAGAGDSGAVPPASADHHHTNGYMKMTPQQQMMTSPSQTQTQTPTVGSANSRLYGAQPFPNNVMYVPGRPMDRLEREVAWQRERQKLRHGVQTDTELNLPPAIPISDDGEEGYAHSQRVLQLPTCEGKGGGIRPPPNKTIFQGESPPAYRSNSVSGIDRRPRRAATPSGCGLQQLSDCGSSSPLIARCHSMSCDKSGGGSSPHSLNNPQHMNNNNNKFKVTVPPSVHVASHHGNTHGNVSNLHSAHLPMTTTMAPGHQHHHPHHHHPADPPRHHALPPHYMHSHLYCTAPQPLSEPLPHPSTAPDSRTPTPHNNSSINNGHTKTTHNPSARPGGV